ncbi:lipoprotein-releasing ABC transporter permease subunit LolE [Shewanella sp. WXL01]|uniref:lipoprotein-releasing ABC transporter permease subunit LolE n=1 Tax=Shewanella sp. WXL01 TaxID=2709721 RepID=UPI001438295A|nr:lipoprotein-releasing ABC transporter permease subunit LolE [Shewanella sp. WXL01]NKF52433.1 lipoprotein-releasing ABC transporter permease subunit LolE [Shewanella sp. WXL01]
MSLKLPLTIGWRFYRQRQANGFINFISFASTSGIALGVAVLIIVLSVMNGFERELQQRLLGVTPHGELVGVNSPLQDWQSKAQSADLIPEIKGVAPFVRLQGLVQKPGGFQGIQVTGIDLAYEPKVSTIAEYMDESTWQTLAEDANNIVLGQALMQQLGLNIGDAVAMYTPQKNATRLTQAKSHRFVVTGSYKLSGEVEQTQAYVPMVYLARLLGHEGLASGIRIKVDNVLQAQSVIRELGYAQSEYVYMNDWTRTQGHLYSDIQLVRVVMYLVLALVIAVACFNIVSTLVMAVRDKASEVAILMTMGLQRFSIMAIFMLQGALNGLSGCAIGGVVGVVIAQNLSAIAKAIESAFGIQLLAGGIYFIDFVPTQLELRDVAFVIFMGLVMSLIATVYPAWKASKIAPAAALAGR